MITVLALGCFDLLHPGHIDHLQAARALGDQLMVAVTADECVNKGPGRPLFSEAERLKMVSELNCVEFAFIHYSAERAIMSVRPDIYVKGKEYEGKLPEQALVESLGGRVVFLDTPVYSSTDIMTGEMLRRKIANA